MNIGNNEMDFLFSVWRKSEEESSLEAGKLLKRPAS